MRHDCENNRPGTASLLAAWNLQEGQVTARVERRQRSVALVGLLQDLDEYYPAEVTRKFQGPTSPGV
ncbi:MAG: hypothetical protein IH623_24955 [Verrucomicrobia bacterium]|nr:hypothetical protein [Verrucomicrobiota bacterium]